MTQEMKVVTLDGEPFEIDARLAAYIERQQEAVGVLGARVAALEAEQRVAPPAQDRALSTDCDYAAGIVRCRTCGRSQSVDSAQSLRSGWPKCCGYTMTIDAQEKPHV